MTHRIQKSIGFRTATGGQIKLALNRHGAAPAPIELVDTKVDGTIHENGDSIRFQMTGTAEINEPDSEIKILSGNVAVSELPKDAAYRLKLDSENGKLVYKLVFPETGSFPISLDFVFRDHHSGCQLEGHRLRRRCECCCPDQTRWT